MPTDWRSGYLEQAKSDYGMLKRLLALDDVPLCQRLHYLQMTTEKLAKGFMTSPGGPRYANTHDAFVKLLRIAKGHPDIRRACGFTQADQFIAYIDSLSPLAQSIEDLSPEGGDHPNPEYPWEAGGVVQSPLDFPFSNLTFTNPKMIKMLEFIDSCFGLI